MPLVKAVPSVYIPWGRTRGRYSPSIFHPILPPPHHHTNSQSVQYHTYIQTPHPFLLVLPQRFFPEDDWGRCNLLQLDSSPTQQSTLSGKSEQYCGQGWVDRQWCDVIWWQYSAVLCLGVGGGGGWSCGHVGYWQVDQTRPGQAGTTCHVSCS